MKLNGKRILSLLLVLVMMFGLFAPTYAAEAEDTYDWQGQWIWTSDAPSEGQWINLRKTFTLNEVPETVEARISVDTKYWLWINGEMAVYEGQLKTGPSRYSWYYDVVDIADYLVEGENTIAVLAYYVHRDSFSTVKTNNQAFLFDAQFPAGALTSGTRLVSDTSWKVQKDPAYETPNSQPNYRVGATNIKYNAAKEQTGWQNPGFDDSKWANATIKTLSANDPRHTLAERSIPQWKVEDVVLHTATGDDKYTVKKGSQSSFTNLSLPESYVVTGEFYADTPASGASSAYGISVCMSDASHFYMPQVSLFEPASGVDYIRFKPHIWNGSAAAVDNLIANRSDVIANEDRFNVKHTVKVEVTPETMTVYVDGKEFGSHTDTTLARAGASIGLRQSSSEVTRLYSLKVEDPNGNLLWEDDISESKPGDAVTMFKKLSGSGNPSYKKDENGETYLHVNNCIIIAGEQGGTWSSMNLPEEYTVSGKVQSLLPSGATSASIGIAACMTDASHFYMPQVSLKEGNSYNGLRFKPHKQQNGWTTYTIVDHSSLIPAADRYTKTMDVEMKVDAEKIVVYVNGTEFGTMANTDLPRQGSIGFRQSSGEHTAIYNLQITDADGKVIWKDDIGKTAVGSTPKQFKALSGKSPVVKEDENGVKYLYLNDTICTVGELANITIDTYTFKNSTNMQGTPYLKVRSQKGGETIAISSDSTAHSGGESVVHWYVTKPGEQEWEAMGWMNGWAIDFEIPSSVEVIALGFRKSGYDSEVGGTASTSNANLNQLYQEAYDTLDVTMRDTYMDCPDRERCQWWGDAVNEMQQAAYAMNHTARLLYKKCLVQAVGWSENRGGSLTTVVATPTMQELPVQSLSGVHSLWQYYLYYGETDILEFCYEPFMTFLKLWTVYDNGSINHRAGNWDWMDWGDHHDTAVTETSWYYVACGNMIEVAKILGKDADVAMLEARRAAIKENFDTLYWNESKGAYYSKTTDSKADDRANAMAVYSGLADPVHYPQILKVFQTIEKASPYMEKYVLEAMYMMGYDDEAVTRTLKRYDSMVKDGYPTLYEYWAANKLSGNGGTGTRNHAWTGAPLSMMYMFNAGIMPTDAGFSTFRVRPMLGTLTYAQASTDTVSGTISVDVTTDTLTVTVPEGSTSAEICVPRLEGTATMVKLGNAVVYDNGAPAAALPTGVAYSGEDVDYVNFCVVPGTYTFTAVEDTAESAETHTLTITGEGSGTVAVNGQTVELPYTYSGTGDVTVTATPAGSNRIATITGTYPETVYSRDAITRTYTLDRDVTCNFTFEKTVSSKVTLKITESTNLPYAMDTYVNGKLVATPYTGAFDVDSEVTVTVKPVEALNYAVLWNGEETDVGEAVITMTDNKEITVGVKQKDCVDTKKITSFTANDALSNSSWGTGKAIDGNRQSSTSSNGFSTNSYESREITETPVVMTLNLGSVQEINQVSLFPRTSAKTTGGEACNYPEDFTIAVSSNGTDYETVYTMVDGENPLFKQSVYCFNTVEAQYVQITVTGLGDSASDENPYPQFRVQLAEIEVAYNSEQGNTEPEVNPDQVAADAVIALIDAIGPVTDTSKYELIAAAYNAYLELTSAQQALVTNVGVLWAAMGAHNEAVDREHAAIVDALIDAIGEVTLNSKAAIEMAREAYDVAENEVKALVTKLAVLEAAEARYAELVAAAEKEAADKAAADAVIAAIAALNVQSLDDEAAVVAARAAYEALTDAQKALVTNAAALEAAEAAIAELKAAAEQAAADLAAAQAVDTLIDAIGEVTKDDAAAVEAAREAYDALNDNAKALVTKLADLEAAEAFFAVVNGTVKLTVSAPESVNVKDGSVTYTVSAENMNGLATVLLDLDLSADLLLNPKVEGCNGWYVIVQTYENGKLTVALGNNQGATGEGDLFTITAELAEQAGNAAVAVTEAQLAAYLGDMNETFVEADLTAASVTVEVKFNPFDLNKDGVVNLLDITRAQRYYGTANADADVSGNGMVDIEDLILIVNNYTV